MIKDVLNSLELDTIIDNISSYCAFSLGKEHLKNLQPSFNILKIKQDNQRIKEALSCTYKYNSLTILGFKDINNALDMCLKDKVLTVNDCLNVLSHLNGIKTINSFFKNIHDEFPALSELVNSLFYSEKLYKELDRCFNEYGDIKDEASEELKDIRFKLRKIESETAALIEKYKRENSSILVDGIVTSRNNRVVVLAKIKEKNNIGGFIHGESSSGLAVYIEPPVFININNRKKELEYKEEEEIEKILIKCSLLIKEFAVFLKYNLETVALLDSLFARANWGKENYCTVANLINNKNLILSKARHPLIDKKKVVSNTYKIIQPYKTLLITGSNTGGKTVSLKIIGLMILMTYSAIPISVDYADIPFFDDVFVSIGDKQSVVSSLSTFSSQLNNIAYICKNASENSLVLLDELGSGTDPKEGESLAISILNYLRSKKCTIVSTTHYGKLKSYASKHDDVLVSMVEFDMNTLTPTYKFIEGVSGKSNAFDIALRYGLNKEIVDNARIIKEENKSNEDELIEKLEKQLFENNKLKEEYENKLNEVNSLKSQLEEKINNFNLKKEKIISDAIEEANEYLQEKIEEADNIIKELKHNTNNLKYHEALKIKKKLKIEDEKTESNIDEDFKIGDTVLIISNNQLAKIVSINKNQVLLDVRGISIKSKLSNIKHTDRKIETKNKQVSIKAIKSSDSGFECNLIGLTVEQALSVFEKFLDNAKFSKLPMIRIIHGDGTGALRKAIHSKLKEDKTIKGYRIAMPNEGGTGATIVTL